MNTPSRLGRCGLAYAALILSLCQSPAHAEALATSTIGAYQYNLIDLDPDDGIEAAITWGNGQVSQSLVGTLSTGVGNGGGPNMVDSKTLSQTSTLPLSGTPSLNYAGYSVSSGSSGSSTTASITTGGQWSLSAILTQGFTLSANTAVTFTALAKSSLGVTVPAGSVVTTPWGSQDNGYFDWAPLQADTKAILFIGQLPEYWWNLSADCAGPCVASSWLRSYATTTESEEKLLQVTLTNATGNAVSSQIGTLAYTGGYAAAPISMVPEPSMSALMLMGLGGLGLMLRRARHAVNG
ncbi:MAG TPA: PEP-CTERM sorting domain-containing protein [Candidatus Aquabacterium excrementipullorum]|nr:PEP-CTERM sorting domain-containing protein [Candidatus Aquabacterium excrementipullorum]